LQPAQLQQSQFARRFVDYRSQHDKSKVQVHAMQLQEQPEQHSISSEQQPQEQTSDSVEYAAEKLSVSASLHATQGVHATVSYNSNRLQVSNS
jgi:hypothetical protein